MHLGNLVHLPAQELYRLTNGPMSPLFTDLVRKLCTLMELPMPRVVTATG